MSTVPVRFVGRDAVEVDLTSIDSDLPALRQKVEPGDVIDVPHDIAYGAPGLKVYDDDGEPLLDPTTGEQIVVNHYGGLLDQADKWQLATPAPEATVEEILAAVAGSPSAAHAALDAELARPKPRRTLVASLEELAAGHDTEKEA